MLLLIFIILLLVIAILYSFFGKKYNCFKRMLDWICINPFLRLFIEMYLETFLCGVVNLIKVIYNYNVTKLHVNFLILSYLAEFYIIFAYSIVCSLHNQRNILHFTTIQNNLCLKQTNMTITKENYLKLHGLTIFKSKI